jgi:hypothetical protein
MNYIFLSRAFVKADIITALLVSKNNCKEILKILGRET